MNKREIRDRLRAVKDEAEMTSQAAVTAHDSLHGKVMGPLPANLGTARSHASITMRLATDLLEDLEQDTKVSVDVVDAGVYAEVKARQARVGVQRIREALGEAISDAMADADLSVDAANELSALLGGRRTERSSAVEEPDAEPLLADYTQVVQDVNGHCTDNCSHWDVRFLMTQREAEIVRRLNDVPYLNVSGGRITGWEAVADGKRFQLTLYEGGRMTFSQAGSSIAFWAHHKDCVLQFGDRKYHARIYVSLTG